MTKHKPHDSHGAKITPALSALVNEYDERQKDASAMPAGCTSPSGCRAHGCHGACLPQDEQKQVVAFDWMADLPHKVMTRAEYDAKPPEGWHKVCHNYDSAGNTGIRYLGD